MERTYIGLVDKRDVPNDYERYIWVADGCVNGIEWCKKHNKEFEILLPNWREESSCSMAVAYLKSLREEIVGYLAKELSVYYGENYNSEAWNFLLYSWLQVFLSSYYDKFLILNRIREMGVVTDIVLYDKYNILPPLDYGDYIDKLNNLDYYNEIQYNNLIEFLNIDVKRRNPISIEGKEVNQQQASIKQNTLQYFAKKIYHAIGTINHLNGQGAKIAIFGGDVYCGHTFIVKAWMMSRGVVTGAFSNYDMERRKYPQNIIDTEWRYKKIDFKNEADDFTRFIYKYVRRELPIALLEWHGYLSKSIQIDYHHIMDVKNILYGAGTVCYDEKAKLYCAKMKTAGAQLCGVQHGGNYGIEKIWKYEDEYSLADIFYTWGWMRNSSGKFIPMPAFRYMRKYRLSRHKNRVLYISYSMPRFFFRFDRASISYYAQREQERIFIRKMNNRIQNEFIIRLYHEDYGWNVDGGVQRVVEKMQIDDEKEAMRSICLSRLIILPDWQTTVNEALISGRPFIFLRDYTFLEDEAKSDIDSLYKVDVACKDWDELYERFESIYDSIEEWWNNSDRQAVIEKMRRKYAYSPQDSEKKWIYELTKLSKKNMVGA